MATDALSTTFAALADPTRRAILARLATVEATVNELATPFDVSVQAVSQHLRVLERAGLLTRGRHAQLRPCRFEGHRWTRRPAGSTGTALSGRTASTPSGSTLHDLQRPTAATTTHDHPRPGGGPA